MWSFNLGRAEDLSHLAGRQRPQWRPRGRSGGNGAATTAGAADDRMRLGYPQPPARRIIACAWATAGKTMGKSGLDVRANDAGDLVGDQYDVREKSDGGAVRNHGKPVALAERYYQEGADATGKQMASTSRGDGWIQQSQSSAQRVFVPLTVGGGIRSYVDGQGHSYSALDVADAYFRAGADKISIGSDAVDAARAFLAAGKGDGTSSIELISTKYGRQAVVVSVDPRRVYVADPSTTDHRCVELGTSDKATPKGPNGEAFAWYCCTVKGGREDSEFDVVQLAQAVEALGAGELLLNCINRDGQGNGYELELIEQARVKSACTLPVIASSGAGCPEHFEDALRAGGDAALAAGIFHREEAGLWGGAGGAGAHPKGEELPQHDLHSRALLSRAGAKDALAPGASRGHARVLTKSDVRKFNNSRGEGQLFKAFV
eukprot:Skav212291  [mRNA]  locus=scaffold732:534886:541698:- [translate_table: standard]